MVGVPGKSKGCSTCRRRKKGCGQERPSCRQCLNSGHVCGGYERHLTFILHPASKDVEDAVFLPVRPAPPLLALLPSLDRSTMLLQCRNLFFGNFLPQGQCIVRDLDILKSNHPTNWVELIPGFMDQEASLELAFSALSIARVGRNNNDTRLVKESTKIYGKALRSLQKALFDPKRMCSEQILAACQTLGLYESYEGAGGRSAGWISHAQGAARIIELQGPHAFIAHSAHFLFVGSRVPIIYSATIQRKGTFLAQNDWLTAPWSSIRRTGMDFLVDIATQVPSLLEELDEIKADSLSSAQQVASVACLDKFQAAEKALAVWLVYRKSNAVPISAKHEYMGDEDIYPFTHQLNFENHLFAGSNLFHWAMNLVVSAAMLEILLRLAKLGHDAADLARSMASTQRNARQYATNIAQAIPYCLLPEMGDLGINMVIFPMCLAFKLFSSLNETKICAWLVKMCDDMKHVGLRLGYEGDLSQLDVTSGHDTFLELQASFNSALNRQGYVDEDFEDTDPTPQPWDRSPRQIPQEFAPQSTILRRDESDVSGSDSISGRTVKSNSVNHGLHLVHDDEIDSLGDLDSAFDAMSPKSGISHASSTSSRGYNTITALGVPKNLAHVQMVNASKGEFTFVAEDPSNCYIVSDQRKT